MACTERRFFGVPVVEQSADDLADYWGQERSKAELLMFADRPLMWRISRSRGLRQFFLDSRGKIAPNCRGAHRQIRVATGCVAGPFVELQSVVRILARAEQDTASVYLVGRSQDQLQRAEQNVRATFPKLRVVGRAVFHPGSLDQVTTAIRKSAPRIVLVGSESTSVLKWLSRRTRDFGPVRTIVAYRAIQRMAGHRTVPRASAWFAVLVRPLVGPALIIHRIIAARRRKKLRA